jgi:hypothetical protein
VKALHAVLAQLAKTIVDLSDVHVPKDLLETPTQLDVKKLLNVKSTMTVQKLLSVFKKMEFQNAKMFVKV